jgi:ribosomal protein L7/L12
MDKKNKTVLRSHKMRVISNYQSTTLSATIMEKEKTLETILQQIQLALTGINLQRLTDPLRQIKEELYRILIQLPSPSPEEKELINKIKILVEPNTLSEQLITLISIKNKINDLLVPSVDQVDQEELFTVVIEDAGLNKMKVTKEIRTIDSSIGLNEAMDLVRSVPATVLKTVDKTRADKAKAALEAAGAKVSIV